MNPEILLDSVSVHFGTTAALNDLTLRLPLNESTAVLGISGSGKSLVLKAAAGLLIPDDGRVFFCGRAISDMSHAEYQRMQARTGFHFQDAALWSNQSLQDNLRLPLLAAFPSMTEAEVRERVGEAFASLELDLDPNLRPAALSMGQRKMVSFLRATVCRPEILFLDEPTSFLDSGSRRRLLARIDHFRKQGMTMVIATHNRELGARVADRVAVLSHGGLEAAGGYQQIMTEDDGTLARTLGEQE